MLGVIGPYYAWTQGSLQEPCAGPYESPGVTSLSFGFPKHVNRRPGHVVGFGFTKGLAWGLKEGVRWGLLHDMV